MIAAGAMALLAGTPVAAFALRGKAHPPKPPEPQVIVTGVVEVAPVAPPPDTVVTQGDIGAPPPPEHATAIMGGMPMPSYEQEKQQAIDRLHAAQKTNKAKLKAR